MIGADHLILSDGEDLTEAVDTSLEGAVRKHVQKVLSRAKGDEAEAAKLLGITKKELTKHLQVD